MQIECYHITNKDQNVKGFFDYGTCSDLENTVRYNVYTVLEDNNIINLNYTGDDEIEYMCIYAHGSRVFGNPKKDSDIDFVLFYKGSIREDDLFNIFADESIYIEHVKCDFNPIKIENEDDIKYYIQKHDIEYNQNHINEDLYNVQLALDDYENEFNGNQTKSQIIDDQHDTEKLIELNNNFVDLDLPSGTIWCKYNLGVNPKHLENAEDYYGDYYAWGEITPKDQYDWSNYKFGTKDNLTKYDGNDLTELYLEDDAAYQLNNRMKIPSKEQFEELLKYTIHRPVERYNDIYVRGHVFKSKLDPKKELFLPLCGISNEIYRDHCRLYDFGYYWTSTRGDTPSHAKVLFANLPSPSNKLCIYTSFCNRYIGCSIRPVLNKTL